jgi:hypothetical protein
MQIPEVFPQVTLAKGAMYLVGLIVGGFLLWQFIIQPIFFSRADNARERGGRIVAEEQGKASEAIAEKTIEHLREREVIRERTREIVERGQEEVNNAWQGETVGNEVDAAGAAALCELHADLCRRPVDPAEVQPIR